MTGGEGNRDGKCLCVCFENIRKYVFNNMQRYRIISFSYEVRLMKSGARLPHQDEKRKFREVFCFSYLRGKTNK